MREFLNSISYFRGIAIIIIVAGHSYGLGGWTIDTFPEKVLANLISGGTALFVFLSGFLFHYIYYAKFEYKHYLLVKLKNVITPYIILSVAATVYFAFIRGQAPDPGLHFTGEPGLWHQYLRPTLLYLITGRILPPYWFMPFITVMFILSPFHVRFTRLKPGVQVTIIIALTILAVFLHRPCTALCVWQSVLYFTPVYLLGITCSIHKERIYAALTGWEWLPAAAAFILALLQVRIYGGYDNLTKPAFDYGGMDLMLLQKICWCLFFMVFLHRFEHLRSRPLHLVASASFAIFFLHPWVLKIYGIQNELYVFNLPGGLQWIYKSIAVVIFSILAADLIRLIFRSRSRQVIGW